MEIPQEALIKLYEWVDELTLSRPKKNIHRDFADGILVAEIVKIFYPRLVDIHNYPATLQIHQKIVNWETLKTRVLQRLDIKVSKAEIQKIVKAEPFIVEKVLLQLKQNIKTLRKSGQNPEPKAPAIIKVISPRNKEKAGHSSVDLQILQLKQTIEGMNAKIIKLQHLLKLKNAKISMISKKLLSAGIN